MPPGARAQLQNIFNYLNERNPAATSRVLSRIHRTAELLKTNNRLGGRRTKAVFSSSSRRGTATGCLIASK